LKFVFGIIYYWFIRLTHYCWRLYHSEI